MNPLPSEQLHLGETHCVLGGLPSRKSFSKVLPKASWDLLPKKHHELAHCLHYRATQRKDCLPFLVKNFRMLRIHI